MDAELNAARPNETAISPPADASPTGASGPWQRTMRFVVTSKRLAITLGLVATAAVVGGASYWYAVSSRIYIENAEVSAPAIPLSAQTGGILKKVFIKEGQALTEQTQVALVGDEAVRATASGIVIHVENDIGKLFERGEPVVTMINPRTCVSSAAWMKTRGSPPYGWGSERCSPLTRLGQRRFRAWWMR